MTKTPIFPLFAAAAVVSFAQSPGVGQDYYYIISKPNYKLILLGEWKPDDKAKWARTLDAAGIFEYGFILQDRVSYSRTLEGHYNKDPERFERWLCQFSGAPLTAKWIALGMDNRLIGSGVQALGAKEFDALLERNGVESPQKIIRAFLQTHPGHLDATSDYLQEVRRRAILRLASNAAADSDSEKDQDKDLDTETDLRTWGVLAAETDRIFNDSWRGMYLDFFKPEEGQPEKYSPLMRACFGRHISKVEAALQEQPNNWALWDIWGWMAMGLSDYKSGRFLSSIKSLGALPAAHVCVWLVDEARSKSDWQTVAELGERARGYAGGSFTFKYEWIPGGSQNSYAMQSAGIRDWPYKSAWLPQLEALLRLNRIEEANGVFDKLILSLREPHGSTDFMKMAADTARAAGMENIAKVWERGELINKIPHAWFYVIRPAFLLYANRTDEYFKEFEERVSRLGAGVYVTLAVPDKDVPEMGWKVGDGHRWALINIDTIAVAEGRSMPEADEMQGLIKRFFSDEIELGREYIKEHPDQYDSMLRLAFRIITQNYKSVENDAETTPLDADEDAALWGEAAGLLRRVLANAPHLLIDLPNPVSVVMGRAVKISDALARSSLLKSLSGQYLQSVEMLLEKKPSAESLWYQWFFWRAAEGEKRPLAPIVERVTPSPFSAPETVPPMFALDEYYNECRRMGAWQKVIDLLNVPWEREILRIDESRLKNPDYKIPNTKFGDSLVTPLIEAYLNDGKTSKADDVLSAWVERGGSFADPSKLIELAKEKGNEGLGRDWERKTGKGK